MIPTFLLLAGALFGTGQGEKAPERDEVTLFVAASATDLIEAVTERYQEERDLTVNVSPASSGTLARQIEQGAQPDLYVSASRRWVEYVDSLGRVVRYDSFARNRLAVVVPEDSEISSFHLSQEAALPAKRAGLVAIGDPRHVPAGTYAKEALEHFGWYEEMEERLLPTADVRAALVLVELGEVDMGIVYETDAMRSGGVRIVAHFPEESHSPIEYYCALLKSDSEAATRFYEWVTRSSEVRGILRANGFSPVK